MKLNNTQIEALRILLQKYKNRGSLEGYEGEIFSMIIDVINEKQPALNSGNITIPDDDEINRHALKYQDYYAVDSIDYKNEAEGKYNGFIAGVKWILERK